MEEAEVTALLPLYTFSVVALELASTRIYSYLTLPQHTSLALGLAMLGLGLGPLLRRRFRNRTLSLHHAALAFGVWCPALALGVSFGVGIIGFAIGTLVAFALSGVLVSAAYAATPRERMRWRYAMDLSGAALACELTPKALDLVGPLGVFCGLGALAGVAVALLFPRRTIGLATGAGVTFAGIGLLVASTTHRLPDRELAHMLAANMSGNLADPRNVVDSEWSSVGRLDVIPLSRDISQVFTDGQSPTLVLREHDRRAPMLEVPAVPYAAFKPNRALVLGSGGGLGIGVALEIGGASQVDAVELNPGVKTLMARWRRFAGPVYDQPGVRLYIDDARGFLLDHHEPYDSIELTLAQTGTQSAAHLAAIEAHLFTSEAMRLYLDRLSERGAVFFIADRLPLALRLMLTALDAVQSRGAPLREALDHVAVLRNCKEGPYAFVIIAGRQALSEEARSRLLSSRIMRPIWVPGMPMTGPAQHILEEGVERYEAGIPEAIAPVSDDSPYFFNFEKGLRRRFDAVVGLAGAAGLALLLAMALVVERGVALGRSFLRPGLMAACLGVGFMAVEISIIQRLIVAAGGPMTGLSFLLLVLLLWCAIGSLVVAGWLRRIDRGLQVACCCGVAAVGAALLALRHPEWLTGIASSSLRHAAVAAVLAPVGLALGSIFPTLLAQQQARGQHGVASLWAINGAASVTGATVAYIVIRLWGSTPAFVVAGAAYVIAATLAPRRADPV
jgi:spermidine synthase